MEGDPRAEELVRAHLIVRGVVQGVFFRANMKRVAEEYNVKGWVRNLPDGESVEAVLEGRRADVERVICWSLRGPLQAVVRELHIEYSEHRGEFKDFRIRYY
ncbi:MAG: acylphosphatase [Desulfurococcales archaeon]|nr:acylphosphatase [Desulfurococcales archaeon]